MTEPQSFAEDCLAVLLEDFGNRLARAAHNDVIGIEEGEMQRIGHHPANS